MKKFEIELIAKADKAIAEVASLKEELEKTRKTVDTLSKNTNKKLGVISKAAKALKRGFGAAGIAVKGFFLELGKTAFQKFTEVAMQNQVVVDGLAVAFGTISAVVNKVVDGLVDAYNATKGATGGFDALGKILKNTLLVPVNAIVSGFYGLQSAILYAQASWESSFLGDNDPKKLAELNKKIDESNEKFLKYGNNLVDNFANIGEGFGEAVEEVSVFTEEAVKNIKKIDVAQEASNQTRIQTLRNETAIALAENDKLQFQYQLAAERQRQIRDDVTASIEDRTKANDKLGEVLQEQFKLQEANALKGIELAKAELAANPKSIEAKVALIEAEKNLLDVKENIAGFESEQRVNREALELEAIDLTNSKAEAENARSIAKKQQIAEEINDEVLRLQRLKEIAEEEKELEEQRLQEQINRLGVGTQARQDAEQQLADFKQESQKKIDDLDKDAAAAEKARAEDVAMAKLQIAARSFQLIGAIAKEGSQVAKTAAIAQATVEGIQGVISAYKTAQASPITTVFPAYPVIQAALAAGFAAVNIAKIKQQNMSSPSGVSDTAPSQPQAPSFNVVGAAPENQLAEALGDQQKQPVKAYVVSNEVSNAQALDRNIIEGASIG